MMPSVVVAAAVVVEVVVECVLRSDAEFQAPRVFCCPCRYPNLREHAEAGKAREFNAVMSCARCVSVSVGRGIKVKCIPVLLLHDRAHDSSILFFPGLVNASKSQNILVFIVV